MTAAKARRAKPKARARSVATTVRRCAPEKQQSLECGLCLAAVGGGQRVATSLGGDTHGAVCVSQEDAGRGDDSDAEEDGKPNKSATNAAKPKAKSKAKKKGKDDWSDDDDTPKKGPGASGATGESEVRFGHESLALTSTCFTHSHRSSDALFDGHTHICDCV